MKNTNKVVRSEIIDAPTFNKGIEKALANFARFNRKPKVLETRVRLAQLDPAYLEVMGQWILDELVDDQEFLNGKVSVEWQTGGLSSRGWNYDLEQHALSAEPEPEFDRMDKILEKVWPEITYLQYKVLAKEVLTQDSRSDCDYYGGHTDYAIKSLDLYKLWQHLHTHRK